MKMGNLDFNGQGGQGFSRNKGNGGNYSGQTMRENYGRGPVKGNQSSASMMRGSATGDKHKLTIATASQGGKINGGAMARCPANPDKINMGMK